MSQINVDTVVPFTVGTNVVSVKGVKIALNNDTMQISDAGGLLLSAQSTAVGKGSRAGNFGATANTSLGYNAGFSLSSGSANTLVGAACGGNMNTGLSNTFVGNNVGANVTSGNSNVFVGTNIANIFNPFTGQNNICIGSEVTHPSAANVSNEITLGNASITALRCAVTSITSLSDARDKKDVTDLRAGLEFVKGLRPVEFVWDDREEHGKHDVADFGFIAQDLKAAQEDAEMADVLKLVYQSNPEKLEASYGKLLPILVKAIQELAAEVEALKAKK
jgi:hypothetical protein